MLGAPSLSEFLRLRSAWGTCFGLFCGNYLNYFLISWLPFYLVHERNFSMHKMAKVGGTAYLCAAAAASATGWLSDRWIMAGGTPTQVRKTIVAGGIALSGVFLALAAFGGPVQCIAMLVVGMIFFGVGSSNVWAITQTLAGPTRRRTMVGLSTFCGEYGGSPGSCPDRRYRAAHRALLPCVRDARRDGVDGSMYMDVRRGTSRAG